MGLHDAALRSRSRNTTGGGSAPARCVLDGRLVEDVFVAVISLWRELAPQHLLI